MPKQQSSFVYRRAAATQGQIADTGGSTSSSTRSHQYANQIPRTNSRFKSGGLGAKLTGSLKLRSVHATSNNRSFAPARGKGPTGKRFAPPMSNAPPSVDPPELAQHREKVKNKRAIESLMNLDSISHSSDGTDIHATIGKAMSRKTLDAVRALPPMPAPEASIYDKPYNGNSSVVQHLMFGTSHHDGTRSDPVSIEPTQSSRSAYSVFGHVSSSIPRAQSAAAIMRVPSSMDVDQIDFDLVPKAASPKRKNPVQNREEYIKLINSMTRHSFKVEGDVHLRRSKSMYDVRLSRRRDDLRERDGNVNIAKTRDTRYELEKSRQSKELDGLLIKPRKPLTQQERVDARKLTNRRGDKTEVVLNVSYDDLASLQPGTWLNDEVCNKYFKMIQARSENNPGIYPKVWVCSTFFWFALQGKDSGVYNYNNVRRWSTKAKVKVFELDMIICPIHVGKTHWTVSVCDLRDKKFYYYDSLNGRTPQFEETWRRYIMDEHKNKLNADLPDPEAWHEDRQLKCEPPQQDNGYDCGVFMCHFADCLARDVPFDFDQSMAGDLRLRMALDIKNEQLSTS